MLKYVHIFRSYYRDKNLVSSSDRMARLASHLLSQHNFYPLYPPHKGICLDHGLFEQYGIMDCKPHILILPSNLRHFIKVIYFCRIRKLQYKLDCPDSDVPTIQISCKHRSTTSQFAPVDLCVLYVLSYT